MEQRQTHGDLLITAREGDEQAWNELVDRFSPLIWSVTRSFRLDRATATDVAQSVWLKLVENCDRISDPERLPGWIATTCRREAISTVRRAKRAIPTEFEYDVEDPTVAIESALVEDEEHAEVRRALRTLSDTDQQLLTLMSVEPDLSYEEIAEAMDRPIGSLGPTRARALERLRRAIRVGERVVS